MTNNHQDGEENLIAGYADLAQFLTKKGFRIAKRTLEVLCSKGSGPPIHARWGTRNTFLPSEAIAWARGRLFRTPKPPQIAVPVGSAREDDDVPPL
jgi:hypothetical protein